MCWIDRGLLLYYLYVYSVEMLFIIYWILDRDDLDSRPQIWGCHRVVSEIGVIVLRNEIE